MHSKCTSVVIIVCVGIAQGCSSDYVEDFGHGYRLARTNKYNHSIVKEYEVVVDSNIANYSVEGQYVLGARQKPAWFDVEERLVPSKYGYFVRDKVSGALVEGMDKDSFFQRAAKLAIGSADLVEERFRAAR